VQSADIIGIIAEKEVSSATMTPDCGTDVHRISECCAATVSYVANFLLMMLIVFRTPKELRVYGRVLLANCVVDLTFTTASFVIEAVRPVTVLSKVATDPTFKVLLTET
jgi:hypothetical protein